MLFARKRGGSAPRGLFAAAGRRPSFGLGAARGGDEGGEEKEPDPAERGETSTGARGGAGGGADRRGGGEERDGGGSIQTRKKIKIIKTPYLHQWRTDFFLFVLLEGFVCLMKRFVFLEGGPAVGKSAICSELSRRGFRVHFELFVDLCEKHPEFRPGGLVMSFLWGNEMIARMEEFNRSRSDGLFFFDRSLLTPFVFARANREHLAFYVDLMQEVRSVFPCSVVLLNAEADTVKSRLMRRYEQSTEAEKEIRQNLGEMNDEWVKLIDERYEELFQRPGVFDMSLDTSVGTVEKTVDELLSKLEKHT